MAEREVELRKKMRFLEKKSDLIKQDWEDFKRKVELFEVERSEFDEWAAKIKETSHRLHEEREKVLVEKAQYDYERDQLERWKMDLDL